MPNPSDWNKNERLLDLLYNVTTILVELHLFRQGVYKSETPTSED